MINISSIQLEYLGASYEVSPRLELITNCTSKSTAWYEVLSIVMKEGKCECPITFFSKLDDRNTYRLYRHCLEEAAAQGVKNISLNADIELLSSSYIELLVEEFTSMNFVFEYSEMHSNQSLRTIKSRLAAIRLNPRVSIWLDDFGTKSANFDLISRIDFDGIKMSKELFWDLYARDRTLLRHLIKLMKSKANIAVIEGVDTFDKYIFCRERNCLMQGYFFIEIERKGVS